MRPDKRELCVLIERLGHLSRATRGGAVAPSRQVNLPSGRGRWQASGGSTGTGMCLVLQTG